MDITNGRRAAAVGRSPETMNSSRILDDYRENANFKGIDEVPREKWKPRAPETLNLNGVACIRILNLRSELQ